eukprot:scaffold4707_cov164-Amphora_coffeaeformis.AAC.18
MRLTIEAWTTTHNGTWCRTTGIVPYYYYCTVYRETGSKRNAMFSLGKARTWSSDLSSPGVRLPYLLVHRARTPFRTIAPFQMGKTLVPRSGLCLSEAVLLIVIPSCEGETVNTREEIPRINPRFKRIIAVSQ